MTDIKDLKFYISEIFYSIQGEGLRAGLPCIFVRMQGCMLRCGWCDTKYAQDIDHGGILLNGDEIISRIKEYNCSFIEFTGGEPLHQLNVLPLMKYLCDEGFLVALETNGHVDISPIDRRVIKIVDMKCPGSSTSHFNNYKNFEVLLSQDEVKFVISDRNDFDWAKEKVTEYSLHKKAAAVHFSPAYGLLEPEQLSKWILEENLSVRLHLQLHKYIWEPCKRGV
jgi:7-carboxy-7-deazaguanine synthase